MAEPKNWGVAGTPIPAEVLARAEASMNGDPRYQVDVPEAPPWFGEFCDVHGQEYQDHDCNRIDYGADHG